MRRRANAWISLLVAGLASLVGVGEKMHPPRLSRTHHEPTLERRDDSDLLRKLPDEVPHVVDPAPAYVSVVAGDSLGVALRDTGLRPSGVPAA